VYWLHGLGLGEPLLPLVELFAETQTNFPPGPGATPQVNCPLCSQLFASVNWPQGSGGGLPPMVVPPPVVQLH
jgi:hypothetical protein